MMPKNIELGSGQTQSATELQGLSLRGGDLNQRHFGHGVLILPRNEFALHYNQIVIDAGVPPVLLSRDYEGDDS